MKVSWLERFPYEDHYSANYQHGWRLTVPSGIHRLPLCSHTAQGGAVICPGQNRHSSWYSGSLEQILTDRVISVHKAIVIFSNCENINPGVSPWSRSLRRFKF